jgi:uncharacterized protein (TIGR01777 family)
MKIFVTGSTGLVGSHLVPHLEAAGHTVVPIVRAGSRRSGPAVEWDPDAGRLDGGPLEGADAVVHLAGESIAGSRWTESQKEKIRESRLLGTGLLARTLAGLRQPPKTLLSASAVGYYGDRGAETLTESSLPGNDFLAEVCQVWESSTAPARERGVRVVPLRFGLILSRKGGALPRLLTPFQFGVGGIIGDGRQYMSWITIDDVVGAIGFALSASSLHGPVNATAPQPVTNHDFTKALGRVLWRPTFLPLPAFAARILLGEMADALLLSSQRVLPARLLASGYSFQHPRLDGALRHVLGKPAR